MQLVDIIEEHSSDRTSSVGVGNSHEVSIFAKSVHYHKYNLLAFRFREPLHEIHTNIDERICRNRERL